MYMKSMSWISIVALVPAVFLVSSANYRIVLQFVVCWTAVLVVIQAFRADKYGWAAAFAGIALLFNPFVPVALSDHIVSLVRDSMLRIVRGFSLFCEDDAATNDDPIAGPKVRRESL